MKKTRLADRGKRTGRELGRKKVYLIDNNDAKVVEHVYTEKFRPIFTKALDALEIFPKELIPELISQKDLFLSFEYAGKPIAVDDISAFHVAYTISRLATPASNNKLLKHRYLKELEEFHPNHQLHSSVWLHSYDAVVKSGPGIDDPVLSNYVQSHSGRFKLVDLDNFQPSISIGFQIGFLITDILVLNKSSMAQGFFLDIARKYWVLEDNERLALLHGYCSRLYIAALDYSKNNPNLKNDYLEVIDAIDL